MTNLRAVAAVVAVIAVPTIARADADPVEPSAPLAEIHAQSAHSAALRGDCKTARMLGGKVRAIDPAYYEAAVATDAVITDCGKAAPAEVAAADAPPPPAGVTVAAPPAPARRSTFVTGGVRAWNAGFSDRSIAFLGLEAGSYLGRHAAVSLDYSTNVEYDAFALHMIRAGVRGYLLPGNVSPYAVARAGVLVGDADYAGVWTLGGGLQASWPSSGLLLDLGVGWIGAFEGGGTVMESSFSVGKQF